jgi:hypothetical protein
LNNTTHKNSMAIFDKAKFMRCSRGPARLEAFRILERLLPVRIFYELVNFCVVVRTFLARWIPGSRLSGDVAGTPRSHADCMNSLLEYLPDRLCSVRWRKRCRIVGLDGLSNLRQGGRLVMLAFFHFGPYSLIGFWLRASGFPVTTLSVGSAGERPLIKRYKDRYLPNPTIPSVLYLDQVRELVKTFSAGGVMLVAVDGPFGRQFDLPVGGEDVFRMATGPIRLAAKYGAELIPCNIIHEGPWRFRIEIGRCVPVEYLSAEPDMIAAGKHLIAESLAHWRRYPGQCAQNLLHTFQEKSIIQ